MRPALKFEQRPVDHLLQLLKPNELQGVLESVIFNIANQKEYKYLLGVLKKSIEKTAPKIVLKTARRHYVLHTKDITHLEADGAYTSFFTATKKIVVSKNIKHYQDILDSSFIRCHQSYLVNSNHILGVDTNGLLQLTNNKTIPISVRKKPEIIKLVESL